MRRTIFRLALVIPTTLLAACISDRGGPTVQGGRGCSLDSLPELPDVKITSVTQEEAPAPHCKVAGVIGTETNFELLLPDDWNGKFVMGGGGGFVGTVQNSALAFGALQSGYASVGTDTGLPNAAAGPYVLQVVNLGATVESVSIEVLLTTTSSATSLQPTEMTELSEAVIRRSLGVS